MLHFRQKLKAAMAAEEGFSLLELLVVLVVISLIVGIAGPMVVSQLGNAKTDTARIEVSRLVTSAEMFRVDVGRFPTEAEGLSALLSEPGDAPGWSGPYLQSQSQTLDPWNNAYLYSLDPSGLTVIIETLGADGATGGDGENTDVASDDDN